MNCRKSSTKSRVAVVLREQQDGSFVRTRRYQLAEIDSSQIPDNELQNRRVYVRDPSVSFRNAKSSLRSYFPVFRNNTVDYELSFPIQYRPSNGHFIKGLGHMISPENFTPDFPEAYRPLSAFSLESRHPTADEQTEEVEATFLCAPPSEWRPLDWDIVFIRSRHDRRICATLVIFRTERSVRVGFVRHHKGCNMSWVMEKLRNTVASTEEDPSVLLSDLSVVLSDTGSRILTRRSVMRAGLSASPNLMTMGPEMKTVVVDISSEACGQKPIIGIYTHEGSLEEDITPSSSDDDEFRHLRCASTETFREMNTQMATIKRRERGLGLIAWIGGYQLVNSDKLPVFTA